MLLFSVETRHALSNDIGNDGHGGINKLGDCADATAELYHPWWQIGTAVSSAMLLCRRGCSRYSGVRFPAGMNFARRLKQKREKRKKSQKPWNQGFWIKPGQQAQK